MSKIELPTVTGNNNISRINDNFKKIEDALNQEVLYRKGYVGEPNEMDTNLDMNGKEILNVATGTSDGSLVTKSYVDQGLSLKFDKSGGPLSGPIDMQNNQINNLPNATQPSQPATYAQLLQVEAPGDSLLRSELAADGGAGLVGGLAKPVTWSGFAGGADPTGATASDAAFAAAIATDVEVYIPSGTYLLTSNHIGRFVFADGCEFSGAGKAYKKNTGLQTNANPGVSIDRFNRVFVGDAAYSNDGSGNGAVTWLGRKSDAAPNGSLQPGLTWPERTAQFATVTSDGGIAVMGGAHTKQLTTGSSQGLAGFAVNDNDTANTSARGIYLDAKRYANSVGPAYSAELQITNLGSYVDEYASSAQKTFGLAIFAGGDPVINGNTDDVTLGISFANNGAKFGTGITFSTGALRTITEGSLSYGRAMTLRGGQRIGWEDSSGNTRAYLNSVVTDNTRKMGVMFQNGVFDVDGPSSKAFRASGEIGDSAYLRVRSSSQANANVRLEVEGETNCSLSLEAKGTGNIIVNKSTKPNTPNALTSGVSSSPWAGGFTQTAFTITSDERYKTTPLQITDEMLDAASEVDWCVFQYLDRVEAKGKDARWHFGAMAQRFVEAFERHGIDAHDYAFICYDEWESSPELAGEDGEVISPAIKAGSRYGIRYDQAIILKQKQIERDHKRKLDALEARLAALEKQ